MAADDTSVTGTGFWTALGTETGTGEAPAAPALPTLPTLPDDQDKLVAGRPRNRSQQAADRPGPGAPASGSAVSRPGRPESREEQAVQMPAEEPSGGEEREPAPAPDAPAAPAPEPPAAEAPVPASDWLAAEEIARSLRPRLFEIWTEALTRHTGGDEALAGRVYDVLSGCHLLGELWRDESVDEVHVRGAEVTVCGRNGMHQVAGFPDLATARRAVDAFRAAQHARGAAVSRVGDAVVVSRTPAADPTADWLLDGGVITDDQLSQVTMALRHMRTVTVTGPAARIVVRALASLIPAGSRVFLGSYATLPAGCVTAASPMEADYVVGVRPGALAEDMAAEGQVGALIANPATRVRAALRLAVSGPAANPGEISHIP